MSQIRKHLIRERPTLLRLPVGTRVLAVGMQGNRHYIWTDERTGASAPHERWAIWVMMTGDYPQDGLEHIGTHVGVDGNGADYVAHFYKEPR